MKRNLKMFFVFITLVTLINFFMKSNSQLDENFNPETCARFPKEENIFIDNLVWQVFKTKKGFVKLLNAYLDTRWNSTVVRVNANGPNINSSENFIYCQFWIDSKTPPLVIKATEILSLWTKSHWKLPKTNKHPFMINCPYPLNSKPPVYVSLTSEPCEQAENRLKIIDNQPKDGIKKKFGICTKYMNFEEKQFTIRFIEWLHLLRILGFEKIHLSHRYVTPELFKIMQYYEEKGYLEMDPFLEHSEVPDEDNNEPLSDHKLTLEVNVITDCFYKVRNLYEYIGILDPDEIFVPVDVADRTWHDVMKRVVEKEGIRDAYYAQNIIFPKVGAKPYEDIPGYYYILQHTERTKDFYGPSILKVEHHFGSFKAIMRPENVLTAFNHGPLTCFNNNCTEYYFPTKNFYLAHYRNSIQKEKDNITVTDKTLWKYKDELIKAVEETLRETNYKPEFLET